MKDSTKEISVATIALVALIGLILIILLTNKPVPDVLGLIVTGSVSGLLGATLPKGPLQQGSTSTVVATTNPGVTTVSTDTSADPSKPTDSPV